MQYDLKSREKEKKKTKTKNNNPNQINRRTTEAKKSFVYNLMNLNVYQFSFFFFSFFLIFSSSSSYFSLMFTFVWTQTVTGHTFCHHLLLTKYKEWKKKPKPASSSSFWTRLMWSTTSYAVLCFSLGDFVFGSVLLTWFFFFCFVVFYFLWP